MTIDGFRLSPGAASSFCDKLFLPARVPITPLAIAEVIGSVQGSKPDSVCAGSTRPTFLEQLDRVAEVEHSKVATTALDSVVDGIAQHLLDRASTFRPRGRIARRTPHHRAATGCKAGARRSGRTETYETIGRRSRSCQSLDRGERDRAADSKRGLAPPRRHGLRHRRMTVGRGFASATHAVTQDKRVAGWPPADTNHGIARAT